MTLTLKANEALDMIKRGEAVLIDVRESDEFKVEHIAYAMSVPLSSLEDGFKNLNIPLNKTIIFQCLKGARGGMACERIQGVEHCQNKIANIEGGIDAWKAQDLPVIGSAVEASSTKFTIFRQVQMIVGSLVLLCVILGFSGITSAFVVAGMFGGVLALAGLTGWCGLAMLLMKMPWNK